MESSNEQIKICQDHRPLPIWAEPPKKWGKQKFCGSCKRWIFRKDRCSIFYIEKNENN